MDKVEHGLKLKAAMAAQVKNRSVVATATGVKDRTVTNWTSGSTMPSDTERAALRRLLGEYDSLGDQVEIAVRGSGLAGFRQTKVIGYYQEQLHEQQRDERGA